MASGSEQSMAGRLASPHPLLLLLNKASRQDIVSSFASRAEQELCEEHVPKPSCVATWLTAPANASRSPCFAPAVSAFIQHTLEHQSMEEVAVQACLSLLEGLIQVRTRACGSCCALHALHGHPSASPQALRKHQADLSKSKGKLSVMVACCAGAAMEALHEVLLEMASHGSKALLAATAAAACEAAAAAVAVATKEIAMNKGPHLASLAAQALRLALKGKWRSNASALVLQGESHALHAAVRSMSKAASAGRLRLDAAVLVYEVAFRLLLASRKLPSVPPSFARQLQDDLSLEAAQLAELGAIKAELFREKAMQWLEHLHRLGPDSSVNHFVPLESVSLRVLGRETPVALPTFCASDTRLEVRPKELVVRVTQELIEGKQSVEELLRQQSMVSNIDLGLPWSLVERIELDRQSQITVWLNSTAGLHKASAVQEAPVPTVKGIARGLTHPRILNSVLGTREEVGSSAEWALCARFRGRVSLDAVASAVREMAPELADKVILLSGSPAAPSTQNSPIPPAQGSPQPSLQGSQASAQPSFASTQEQRVSAASFLIHRKSVSTADCSGVGDERSIAFDDVELEPEASGEPRTSTKVTPELPNPRPGSKFRRGGQRKVHATSVAVHRKAEAHSVPQKQAPSIETGASGDTGSSRSPGKECRNMTQEQQGASQGPEEPGISEEKPPSKGSDVPAAREAGSPWQAKREPSRPVAPKPQLPPKRAHQGPKRGRKPESGELGGDATPPPAAPRRCAALSAGNFARSTAKKGSVRSRLMAKASRREAPSTSATAGTKQYRRLGGKKRIAGAHHSVESQPKRAAPAQSPPAPEVQHGTTCSIGSSSPAPSKPLKSEGFESASTPGVSTPHSAREGTPELGSPLPVASLKFSFESASQDDASAEDPFQGILDSFDALSEEKKEMESLRDASPLLPGPEPSADLLVQPRGGDATLGLLEALQHQEEDDEECMALMEQVHAALQKLLTRRAVLGAKRRAREHLMRAASKHLRQANAAVKSRLGPASKRLSAAMASYTAAAGACRDASNGIRLCVDAATATSDARPAQVLSTHAQAAQEALKRLGMVDAKLLSTSKQRLRGVADGIKGSISKERRSQAQVSVAVKALMQRLAADL